jgi:hypothetical protein
VGREVKVLWVLNVGVNGNEYFAVFGEICIIFFLSGWIDDIMFVLHVT